MVGKTSPKRQTTKTCKNTKYHETTHVLKSATEKIVVDQDFRGKLAPTYSFVLGPFFKEHGVGAYYI